MISIPLKKMAPAEKLEAMEAIWTDLSQTPSRVPVPECHREVLKARRESPATWLDWDQVKASRFVRRPAATCTPAIGSTKIRRQDWGDTSSSARALRKPSAGM